MLAKTNTVQITPGAAPFESFQRCDVIWRRAANRIHIVLDQRRVRYIVVRSDEVRRFAPLPRTVYLVNILRRDSPKILKVNILLRVSL